MSKKRLINIQVLIKIEEKSHKSEEWKFEVWRGWALRENLKLEARSVIALEKTSEATAVPAEKETGIVGRR